MKNLNEEIEKIKKLMRIDEQCGVDVEKCERDLEDKGYTVYNPSEKSSACDNNNLIKCVKEILTNNGINDYIISSTKSSTSDCFVLAKSNKKESGLPKYHFTFYADNQVIFTARLNNYSDNEKLTYKGKYECDINSNILTIKKFNYVGVFESGSVSLVTDKKVKNSSGESIEITPTKAASLNINTGDLKYPDYLTYVLDFNVKNSNITINNIKSLLKT